ncbi:MAG: hypothetical protein AAF598_06095 [Bacteroidota bacterium]
MEHSAFLTQLSLFAASVAGILGLFYLIPSLQPFLGFGWVTWLVFTVISYLMYLLGKRSVSSNQKGAFINMSMFFNGLKIGVSIILVLCYLRLFKPASQLFLIPFFLVYVLFTIFEIYFLSKLAKS